MKFVGVAYEGKESKSCQFILFLPNQAATKEQGVTKYLYRNFGELIQYLTKQLSLEDLCCPSKSVTYFFFQEQGIKEKRKGLCMLGAGRCFDSIF